MMYGAVQYVDRVKAENKAAQEAMFKQLGGCAK